MRSIGAGAIDVTIRRGEAADPVAGVTRLRPTDGAPIDVVVGRSAWQRGVLDRAQAATVDKIVLPVAQVADLVLLNLFAGGPQDMWARLWAQVGRSR